MRAFVRRFAFFDFINKCFAAICERPLVGPHQGQDFGVEEDADAINDCCDLEGAKARPHSKVRVAVVKVADQLVVLLLRLPRLGHSVHDALCIRHDSNDFGRYSIKVVLVLPKCMFGVPGVVFTTTANFEHECELLLL